MGQSSALRSVEESPGNSNIYAASAGQKSTNFRDLNSAVFSSPDPQYSELWGTLSLMARLLYGTGMRLMECVRLRIKDVLLEQNQILVRDGKGFKDRMTILPVVLKSELERHLQRLKPLRSILM